MEQGWIQGRRLLLRQETKRPQVRSGSDRQQSMQLLHNRLCPASWEVSKRGHTLFTPPQTGEAGRECRTVVGKKGNLIMTHANVEQRSGFLQTRQASVGLINSQQSRHLQFQSKLRQRSKRLISIQTWLFRLQKTADTTMWGNQQTLLPPLISYGKYHTKHLT